jgi:hypothetical protein
VTPDGLARVAVGQWRRRYTTVLLIMDTQKALTTSRSRTSVTTHATSMADRLIDHVDALIDGVIVWENLFGTSDIQELSYRVSMTMACVLSQQPGLRLAYQSEIKNLYTLRSKIVHGGRHLRSGENRDKRDRVQELTLLAMRALLDRHPSLVGAKPEDFVAFIPGANAIPGMVEDGQS